MKKRLIVFYSYTGHTKYIAELIKSKLQCDMCEIKPIKPYSDDYDLVVDEYQKSGKIIVPFATNAGWPKAWN